jgi:hypothetical protein
MKTITTEFSDRMPKNGVEYHREGTRRRLFSQCVCKAENEGLPNKFTCTRTITEEEKSLGGIEWIEMTVKAEFTEIAE